MATCLSEDVKYPDFYLNYLMKNQVCVFDSWITKDWPACSSWRSPDGLIDVQKLFENVTGEEKKLSLSNGQVPFDVRPIINDRKDVEYYVIDQYSGQVVFVPSGWYHQVVNMTNCVSINHNWFNATNVSHIWDHLQNQLKAVEDSTKDVSSIPGWHEECQTCLRAYAGINFMEFFSLLRYILITRWPRSDNNSNDLNTFLKKCKSIQYTSLNILDDAMDHELIHLIQTNYEIFQTALKNPVLWREYYIKESKASNWIHMHDFCAVIQIIKEFVQHQTVKNLQLCNGPLQSFWNSL